MHDVEEGVIPYTLAAILNNIRRRTRIGKIFYDKQVARKSKKLLLYNGRISVERRNGTYQIIGTASQVCFSCFFLCAP